MTSSCLAAYIFALLVNYPLPKTLVKATNRIVISGLLGKLSGKIDCGHNCRPRAATPQTAFLPAQCQPSTSISDYALVAVSAA